MDITEQYQELTEKLKAALPLKAFPTRELLPVLRQKELKATLKTTLTITDVHNSGDISGIMGAVEGDGKEVIVCALTHLSFPRAHPLYREILQYQVKRVKRIKKLNRLGLDLN